jgi:hypothetical protein
MKTTFISVMALGVAVAMAGPPDRAAAEPMVLTDAQLDRVTGGETKYLTITMEDIIITSIQTGAKVPDRASLNHNFLGGFKLNPDGTYVKFVPEGGFDRAAR